MYKDDKKIKYGINANYHPEAKRKPVINRLNDFEIIQAKRMGKSPAIITSFSGGRVMMREMVLVSCAE